MLKGKKMIATMLLLLPGILVNAQTNNPENADMMRSNGKIYVVVAVVVTILLGLFAYVFNLDRKISKMEKSGGK